MATPAGTTSPVTASAETTSDVTAPAITTAAVTPVETTANRPVASADPGATHASHTVDAAAQVASADASPAAAPPVEPAAPVPADVVNAAAGQPTAQPAAMPDADEAEMFDLAALGQTFGNKPDKMRKYAKLFLDSARDGMVEVDAALAHGDLVQLSELGHRIKSSARAVGAMRFGNLCLALEQMRKEPDAARARQLVGQMHEMLMHLNELVAQELVALAEE
ncbi:Hpt domain-containing protein [Duganella sp. LX20W]|uniref:Hpt domain-containing protein n=2 Tax=Rugamonas brunnea TaxID=2758569 RepID=A0A7W2IC98_9BURK|nr:Hpt domain-containing protein [Rugamonas brunnea]